MEKKGRGLKLMSRLEKIFLILALTLFTTLLLPILAVYFVKGDNGMAVALLTFFVLNPLVAVTIGIISGTDIRCLFSAPLVFSMLFWVFAVLIFDPAFPLVYSALYLALSAVSMLLTFIIKKVKNKTCP